MKIKCRGYTGNLIYLDANEQCVRDLRGKRKLSICSYEIWLRTDDSAKIELRDVREKEIEVVNEN